MNLKSAFCVAVAASCLQAFAGSFDAAPFALPLPEGNGLLWEDPREIHEVHVFFVEPVMDPGKVAIEYWGSRWPEQHLPKNKEPGGADVGWMELGNWYKGSWRKADAEATAEGKTLRFKFRPVNAKEFPQVKNYPAEFRYTLKLRLSSEGALPSIERMEAFTDSETTGAVARLVFQEQPPEPPKAEAFNGGIDEVRQEAPGRFVIKLTATRNPDPNTFDRTLVTVRTGKGAFTFAQDDLKTGELFVPHLGVAVLPEGDKRTYEAVARDQKAAGKQTLYDRVAAMPEQTWQAAWSGLPRKKSDIYLPLGLDGGRQRFRLDPDGSIRFRTNDRFFARRPGKDSPRLTLERAEVAFRFGQNGRPASRTLEEESIPICYTTWRKDGLELTQTALVTPLEGTEADGPVPEADSLVVFLARFTCSNNTATAQTLKLPLSYDAGGKPSALEPRDDGMVIVGGKVRGQVFGDGVARDGDHLVWQTSLGPRETKTLVVKIPYLVLSEPGEEAALAKLTFERERVKVTEYWRSRLNESARLVTPETMLNEFYRAHAGHLLINCEREPGSTRRFARVGSFSYGAYGNESCMMVVDLDRRGYHQEAQECLDAWLHYQGTVELPGDFSSKEGVLYGAGGYEDGGYNQHHGWILWMMAEHYRFTRDDAWLQKAAPGILAGARWIMTETARTKDRHELERGLLPAGSLEDIGDWWTWLSTSCYTWRGLDSAAWALEQLKHPEAAKVRAAASDYHKSLLANFRKASERSPVARLRDGTAVPKVPSYVHRRGRSFGWICETLEGALHLLITRALDPHSPEAEWILKDYEDNLYLSNQYGYTLDDFDKHWFDRGGMSFQACLLLDVEPYLYRDDIKQALRALLNAQAVSYFPDVRLNTEHAAPYFDDWRGDHYKSSDESNCAGWLRYLFMREEGDRLLIGQAVPRDWLGAGRQCGLQKAATYFGPASVLYEARKDQIIARLEGPTRNPPEELRVRFRTPNAKPPAKITVNGQAWNRVEGDWVILPGKIGKAEIIATIQP